MSPLMAVVPTRVFQAWYWFSCLSMRRSQLGPEALGVLGDGSFRFLVVLRVLGVLRLLFLLVHGAVSLESWWTGVWVGLMGLVVWVRTRNTRWGGCGAFLGLLMAVLGQVDQQVVPRVVGDAGCPEVGGVQALA